MAVDPERSANEEPVGLKVKQPLLDLLKPDG